MMILGHPDTFAFGVELDRSSSRKPWMYGKLCMWVCGQVLGDQDYEVTLSDALVSLNHWVKRRQVEADKDLATASTEVAFFSIEESIYGLEHYRHLLPCFFQAVPVAEKADYQFQPGDAFDDCKIYCIPVGGIYRVIYSTAFGRTAPWSSPAECKVSKAEFDGRTIEVRDLMDAWYSSLP